MESRQLGKDIRVFYVEALSFPAGVKQAWDDLQKMLPSKVNRCFYGISWMQKGNIIYKAGVEETFLGEAERYGCPVFTISAGNYVSETITNYLTNLQAFGPTFQKLLAVPGRAEDAVCVERYKSDKEVICMVKQK
jgi:hypothetical protein